LLQALIEDRFVTLFNFPVHPDKRVRLLCVPKQGERNNCSKWNGGNYL